MPPTENPPDRSEHGICDADECDPPPGLRGDDMLADPSGPGHPLWVWLLLAIGATVVAVAIATS